MALRTKKADGSMSDKREKEVIAALLRRPRYEVIPLSGALEEVEEHVPKHVTMTVTSSPKMGVETTLGFAGSLVALGYRVVPHIAARLVVDEVHLAEILDRLRGVGVDEIFVIAGDAEEPVGKFDGAGALLRAMSGMEHGMKEVGISGYPESHPVISDEATIWAMSEKAPYATHIISQICFDPKVTADWVHSVRNRGIELPLYVGLPGIVSRQKLMKVSAKIGLGESARFLRKNKNWLLRLFASGGYSPNRLIKGLTPAITDERSRVAGFHIYTFNEFDQTEKWRRETLEKLDAANTNRSHKDK